MKLVAVYQFLALKESVCFFFFSLSKDYLTAIFHYQHNYNQPASIVHSIILSSRVAAYVSSIASSKIFTGVGEERKKDSVNTFIVLL